MYPGKIEGGVIVAGREVNNTRISQLATKVGYVFQNARLLNWLTVEGNIQFALEAQEIPKERWHELVTRYFRLAVW